MTTTQLPNGKYIIRDLASGLQGLYTPEGEYISGDLRLGRSNPVSALRAIADTKTGPTTNHAQLSALLIAIAKTALD